MPNPQNFRLNSDYPMDKIVYFHEDTVTLSSSITIVPAKVIQHGLPFTPLLFCVLSEDNWQTTLTEPSSSPMVIMVADGTKISFFTYKSGGGSIKVRIYGFEPNESTAELQTTSQYAATYMLNSDYDYLKLYMDSKITLDSSGSGTITHNLGFVPIALGWFMYNDGGEPLVGRRRMNRYNGMEITTTQIKIHPIDNIVPSSDFYYRIYNNEA